MEARRCSTRHDGDRATTGDHERDTTVSASTVLANAEEFQRATASKELGVRHVLASYFLRTPPDHVSQLAEWRVDRPRAAAALVDFARRQFPDESPAWAQLSAGTPSS